MKAKNIDDILNEMLKKDTDAEPGINEKKEAVTHVAERPVLTSDDLRKKIGLLHREEKIIDVIDEEDEEHANRTVVSADALMKRL